MPVQGLEEVRDRLKLALETIQQRTEATVNEMLMIGGANAETMVPVDTGFLKNSQQRRVWKTDGHWTGALYYEAHYAPYVENAPGTLKTEPGTPRTRPGATGNYWDPDAEPQFLKKGMELMAQDAGLTIMRKHHEL